jgi:hypothetical protein
VYVSLNFGADPGRIQTSDSTEFIHQITNENVPNRGTIVVPATSVNVLGSNYEHGGFLFQMHAGFNRHLGAWIVGLEGGLDVVSGSSDTTSQTFVLPATLLTPITNVTVTRQAKGAAGWSLSGRAGKLMWSDALVYGEFGVTGGSRKLVAVDTWSNVPGGPSAPGAGGATVNLGPLGPYVTTAEENRHTGILFGFGVEKAINDVWGWGASYTYAYFPETTYHFEDASIDVQGPNSQFQPVSNASAAALPSDTTVKSSDHRIVVRVIYRLGFTLPFLR